MVRCVVFSPARLPLLVCLLCLTACGSDSEDAPKSEGLTAGALDAIAGKEARLQAQINPIAPSSKVVSLGDDLPELLPALAGEVGKAKDQNLKAHVELWADWCGPCKKLEASMGDPRMRDAFAGIYLIRLNSDAWGEKFADTGLSLGGGIPAFFELGDDGRVTGRTITGGAWGDNIPENMAPPLKTYFEG